MPRPLVAISCPTDRASWGPWTDDLVDVVPLELVQRVQAQGALAVLASYDPALVERPGELLDRVDRLVLQGDGSPDLRRFEAALAAAARERGLPTESLR